MQRPMRILLVDDEEAILEITRDYLASSMAADVDTASSVSEGLRKVMLESYDAIVSDYQMPGEDGLVFLKNIRSQEIKTPFILFTGKGREEVVIEALNSGADFYLQKGGQPKAQFAELKNHIMSAVKRRRAEAEIVASNIKLNSALDLARIGFWMLDFKTKILELDRRGWSVLAANNGNEKGYKMPLAEFIRGFVHPDDLEPILKMEEAVISSDWAVEKGQEEFRVIGIDGVTRNIRMTYGVSRGADKRPIAFLGAAQDITDQKESERILRESEEKFSKAFHGSAAASVMTRLSDERVIEANDSALTALGYSREELVGRPMLELNVWSHMDERSEVFSQIEKKGVIKNVEVHFRTKRGDPLTALFSAQSIDLKDEKVMLSSILDITERRQVEEELLTNQTIMAAEMAMAHLGAWEYDVRSDQLLFDEPACTLYGLNLETEGRCHMSWEDYLREFVHPDDRDMVVNWVRLNIAQDFPGDYAQCEHRIIRKDGETRRIIVRLVPIRHPEGKIVRTIGVNQDITEYRA